MRRTNLYANRDHALAARKQLAQDGAGAGFGFEALAAQDFFEEVWTIWGDERRLVSARERSLLVWKLLTEQQVLGHTLGTARLLEGFLEQAAGVFDTTPLAATATTSETLKNAVEVLAKAYYVALRERNLVEAGDAAAVLSRSMPAQTQVSLAEYAELLPAQRILLEEWGVDTSVLDEAVCLETPAEGVVPSFLIPAGASVAYDLIKDELESYLAGVTEEDSAQSEEKKKRKSAVVLVKRPREAFDTLAPYLCEQGYTCSVEESVAFLDTWVGKAYNAAYQVLSEDSHWLFAASDFAYNPLSGMSSFAAESLNTVYRADRRLTCDDVQEELARRSTYPLFAHMAQGHAGEALAVFLSECESLGADLLPQLTGTQSPVEALRELIARLVPYDERDRELAMFDELAETIETAQGLGLCPADIFDMLLDVRVLSRQEAEGSGGGRGHIAFTSISAAGKLPEKSYGLVILGDVSTEAFNLSVEHSSLETFANQLGIDLVMDPLQDAFRLFGAVQKAASCQFTCVQPLHNEAMEETFSSCIYDEYRALLARNEGAADETSLLASVEKRRGEEHLNRGLGATFAPLKSTTEFDAPIRGTLTYVSLLKYLPTVEEGDRILPVLSASAIESYLNCPYQWFIAHGLGVSTLDEGYDSRTKGTFVHQVLATFFGQLKTANIMLTTELLQPGSLYDQVFDEVRANQWERNYDHLVALTETEKKDLELLREALRRSLGFQADLPKEFYPTYFEYRITPDEGVDYAGARLRGSIDRVDVNGQTGDFVVLDYKSSAFGHEAPYGASEDEGEFLLPAYVQALIYAEAVRRKGLEGAGIQGAGGSRESQARREGEQWESEAKGAPESRCAGALYLGYQAKSKQNLLGGSYDQSRYKALEFMTKDSQVKGEFSQFLDRVEQSLEPYVQALVAGEIAGNPRNKRSCRYCSLAGRGQCLAQSVLCAEAAEGTAADMSTVSALGVE